MKTTHLIRTLPVLLTMLAGASALATQRHLAPEAVAEPAASETETVAAPVVPPYGDTADGDVQTTPADTAPPPPTPTAW